MSDLEYDDCGDIRIDHADDANIPVNIWLRPDEDNPGQWLLTADNYMPRKGIVSSEYGYRAASSDRSMLARAVAAHWLPLYRTAAWILESMEPHDPDGTASLYYWSKR